jgi:parallel beta-helix repeat protein
MARNGADLRGMSERHTQLSEIAMRHPLLACLLAATAGLLLTASAHAATYRVGIGCDYANLGAAITYAAANDFDGVITLKLRTGTEFIGLYGPNFGYASIEVLDPRWDIVVEGGYSTCTSATPTGITTLKPSRADEGHLYLSNNNLMRRSLTMRRVHLVDVTQGPALTLVINVAAILGAQTEVSGNTGGIGTLIGVGTPASNWPQLTLTEGASVHDNTGSGIVGYGTFTLAHASLTNNRSSYGAGAYIVGAESQLILDSSTGNNIIDENVATGNGGGIYLDQASLNIVAADAGSNSISYNGAGITSNPSSGYGGGIFSDQGHIEFHSGAANAGTHNFMDGNSANYGGAIAVFGANAGLGVPYTFISLLNSRVSSNTAYHAGGALYSRNAVDWTIDRGSLSSCGVDFPTPCSVFYDNQAQNGGADYDPGTPQPNGGVIFLSDDRGDGYSRGIARFYHTLFKQNSDPQGSAAVAASMSGGELVFQRNVFDDNSAYLIDVGTNLIDSRNSKNLNFRYNTLLPTNSTYYALHTLGGTLDITGSVIETPELFGFPVPIWNGEGTAEVLHRGCLVSSTNLIDMNGDTGWVGDARLDASSFAPKGGSPALDHCDYAPPTDFYGYNAAYDVNGVPARLGNFDLGAVEQTDIIFYNGMGNRPGN